LCGVVEIVTGRAGDRAIARAAQILVVVARGRGTRKVVGGDRWHLVLSRSRRVVFGRSLGTDVRSFLVGIVGGLGRGILRGRVLRFRLLELGRR
jgi:hypothetical protein